MIKWEAGVMSHILTLQFHNSDLSLTMFVCFFFSKRYIDCIYVVLLNQSALQCAFHPHSADPAIGRNHRPTTTRIIRWHKNTCSLFCQTAFNHQIRANATSRSADRLKIIINSSDSWWILSVFYQGTNVKPFLVPDLLLFSLFYIIINQMCLGFWLLVGQMTFKGITFSSERLWWIFYRLNNYSKK